MCATCYGYHPSRERDLALGCIHCDASVSTGGSHTYVVSHSVYVAWASQNGKDSRPSVRSILLPLSSASERCSKRDAVYVLYKGCKQGALYAVQNSMRNGSPEPSEGPHTPSSVSAKWVPG
jgi:hypothetical protein